MYQFETLVKVEDVFQPHCLFRPVFLQQGTYCRTDIFRSYGFKASHFIRQTLEVPDFSNPCNCFIMLSERGSVAWSMM